MNQSFWYLPILKLFLKAYEQTFNSKAKVINLNFII